MLHQFLPFYVIDANTDIVDTNIINNFQPFHQLIMCVSGRGMCQSEYATEKEMHPGDILYTYTNSISGFYSIENNFCLKKIAFDGTAIPGLLTYFGFHRTQFLPKFNDDNSDQFDNLYKNTLMNPNTDEVSLDLYKLLTNLGCDYQNKMHSRDIATIIVDTVKQFTEDYVHLSEVPLQQLCQSISMTHKQLNSIILEHENKDLQEYIFDIRMNRIKNYLFIYPSYDLHFISELCGMTETGLYDNFSRYFGITPEQYRRLYWNEI